MQETPVQFLAQEGPLEKGYPLQYSWASLVIQLVKNSPAVWETWVQSLDWEDPLEKGTATHSSILAWRIPWTVQSVRSQRDMTEQLSLFHFTSPLISTDITFIAFSCLIFNEDSRNGSIPLSGSLTSYIL